MNIKPILSAAALVAACSTLLGAYIAVDSTYAHAEDVKELAKQQGEQLKLLQENSARTNLFYISYYESKIKELNHRLGDTKPGTGPYRDIQVELENTRAKLDFAQKSLINR
mgnify:FL=1